MGYSIKELDWNDRPREKLLEKGESQLSNSELLAIILGSGNKEKNAVELAQEVLFSNENSLSNLAKLSLSDLQKFKGIGEAKAINIIAALELGKRRKSITGKERTKISSSRDVFNALNQNFADLYHEEFWILALDRANQIIKKICISHGGFSGTVADPKVIFKQKSFDSSFNYNEKESKFSLSQYVRIVESNLIDKISKDIRIFLSN